MSRLSQAFWFLQIPEDKEPAHITDKNRLKMIFPKWYLTDLDYEKHKPFLKQLKREKRKNMKKPTGDDPAAAGK
jgi:predicted N-acyltransferase